MLFLFIFHLIRREANAVYVKREGVEGTRFSGQVRESFADQEHGLEEVDAYGVRVAACVECTAKKSIPRVMTPKLDERGTPHFPPCQPRSH